MIAELILLLFSVRADAYPEFIGHGYTSCLTCHWSATGGGPLNDYGRALSAAEISAKPFGFGDDEKLGDWSGLFGKLKTPYWIKPDFEFRRLFNEVNPGSSKKAMRYYTMENDFSIAAFTNEDFGFGFIATWAYVEDPLFAAPNRRIGGSQGMARQYYLRAQVTDSFWLYAGFMDKAFGIKTPDHTAVNRSSIHLGQNDQVHALMLTWQTPSDELFFQPFLGNLHLAGADQNRGVSISYEHEPKEKLRLGISGKYETSKNETSAQIAGTVRRGVGKGHAILMELGLKEDKVGDTATTKGAYNYTMLQYQLVRGLNFQSIFQYNKSDFSATVPDQFAWGFGFMYFPMQRIEWRMQAIHQRVYAENAVEDEEWVAQAQLHLSF